MDAMSPEELAAWEKEMARLNSMYQVYYPVAFWVEAILYGLYISMFVSTMRIMLKKRPVETVASRIFLVVTILIFICTTAHNITAISRLIRAYALLLAPPAPFLYFQNYKFWDNYSHLILMAFCTWLGDILVIYRCFLIWRRNKWVIVAPILLLLSSIGTTFVNWHWFLHPEAFKLEHIIPLFYVTFPLNLAQNVLTTSLIAFKIYKQHRETMRSGLQMTAGLNLMGVIRIIVESAMVYTLEMAVVIVLFVLNHPAVVIVQHMLPPTIGIVFCLIAIRTHVARSDSIARPAVSTSYASNALFPNWVTDMDTDEPHSPITPVSPNSNFSSFNGHGVSRYSRHHPRNLSSLGPITVTTVTEQHCTVDSVMSSKSMSRLSKRERELRREREFEMMERAGVKGDGETMDVDLSDEFDEGKSPASVRTFDVSSKV